MKPTLIKRLEAAETKAANVQEAGPIRIVTVDGDFTLEESDMLKAHYGEPETGGRVTLICITSITPEKRPARSLDELIRVWEAATLEAEND